MNKKILVIVLPVIVLFCLGEAGMAQKNDKAVIELLAKYDDAWNRKDRKSVEAVLHPDYLYFTSEGGTTSRQRTLEFLVSPKYVLTFAERSEIITFGTENTVIVSSRWKGKGTYDKELINDDQRCGLVFVKIGKQWKLISEHCAQIVVK